MKKLTITKKLLMAAIIGSTAALFVTACSDDKPKTPAATAKADHNPNPWDHSGEPKVTESQKQHFEKTFAEQCVTRESHGDEQDKERFTKPCNCIARFMAKDLTPQEADKFLSEHENPQSLRIRYENAAYHCLQEKAPPHDPDFSHPQ
jgi:hypothetical protein